MSPFILTPRFPQAEGLSQQEEILCEVEITLLDYRRGHACGGTIRVKIYIFPLSFSSFSNFSGPER